MDTRLFIIPASAMSVVEEKLVKLNKRAVKLGLEEITVAYGKAYLDNQQLMVPCNLTGPLSVSYDNWEFIATLQHLPTGENIIRAITQEYEIPLEYRDSGSNCEHCHVNRYRKDTYVVRHESGEAKQVGSTCIKDFLGGNSPDNIMQRASLVSDVLSLMDAVRLMQGEKNENIFPMISFLGLTAAVIREHGWISKSAAVINGDTATAARVLDNLRGHAYKASVPNAEDMLLAQKASDWAEALSDEEVEPSDYLYNIRALARAGLVGVRTVGYAASIISAYARNTQPATPVKDSEFVGALKDRKIFNLSCKNVSGFDGNYGWTNKYSFQDKDGNILVWLTSSYEDFVKGMTYTIKGTIKAHKEFRGIKETQITRCEVINRGN